MKCIYSPHHFAHVEGHLFFPDAEGACTITLTPAASMTQEELDAYGQRIAQALSAESSEFNPTPEQRQFLYDVMTTAAEGGSNYWATWQNVKRDAELNYLEYEVADSGEGHLEWHHITPETIHEAILKMVNGATGKDGNPLVGRHIAAQFAGYPNALDSTDHDAEGADCAVQIAAFGEVVFG
jgi:hypothetical protein